MEAVKSGVDLVNDDCLYEIFRFLSLKQQLVLCDVSWRFRNVVTEYILKKQFKHICALTGVDEKLSCNEFQRLFELCAHFLESLEIDIKQYCFSSYLGRFVVRPALDFYFHFDLPELRSMVCHEESFHDGNMKLVAMKCPKVEIIEVNSCYVTGKYIENFKNMKVFRTPNASIIAENLNKVLPQLKELHVSDIADIECLELEENTSLVELNVSTKLFNKGFGRQLNKFKNLAYFSILFDKYLMIPPEINWDDFTEYMKQKVTKVEFVNFNIYLITEHLANTPEIYSQVLPIINFLNTENWTKLFETPLDKIVVSNEPVLELHSSKNDAMEIVKYMLWCPRGTEARFYFGQLNTEWIHMLLYNLIRLMPPDHKLDIVIVLCISKTNEAKEKLKAEEDFKDILKSSTYINQGFITLHLMFEGPIDLTYKSEFLDTKIGFFLKPDETTIATTTTSEEN